MLHTVLPPGLCSSGAWWPMVPNFCSWATRKSKSFHTNHMLGTLDFTGAEHWALFNFPWSKALYHLHSKPYLQIKWSRNSFLLIPQLPLWGPLRLSSALAIAVLSTLLDNPGDSRFWIVSPSLQIRVWNLPDSCRSLPFLHVSRPNFPTILKIWTILPCLSYCILIINSAMSF